MSYCHLLVNPGINLTRGFGLAEDYPNTGIWPGDKVRAARDNWGFACVDGCDGPVNVQTTSTQTSITVTWQGDGLFNVGITPGSVVQATASPVVFSGLTPATTYQITINEDCGGGVTTPNVVLTRTTLCADYVHIPNYLSDMSVDTWTKGARWIHNEPEGRYEQQQTQSSNHLDYYQYINSSITSPCFESNGEQFGRLKVQIGGGTEPYYDYMVLEISSDQNKWETLGTYPDFYNTEEPYSDETSAWSGPFPTEMIEMDISEYMGGNLSFRFRFKSDGIRAQNGGPEVTYFEIIGPEGGDCDSTVYDTLTVVVNDTIFTEVFDTTFITAYDTIYTEIFDTTTITEYDTITVTNVITVYVYDTLTIVDTNYYTVYDTITVIDTVNCPPDECTLSAVIPECATLFTVGRPTVTLTALPEGGTPPLIYAWSNGMTGESVTVSTPGVYEVEITDAEGCVAIASKNVALIDNNCSPNPIRLGIKGWLCKGGQSVCVNVNQIEGYLADGWTLGQCGSDLCVTYENRASIIGADGVSYKIEIYPNPSSGKVNILYDGDTRNMTLSISDISGRYDYIGRFVPEIEIGGPDGSYTVNVMIGGAVVHSALIIKQ